jgi:murein tripeptide amidase MpaA
MNRSVRSRLTLAAFIPLACAAAASDDPVPSHDSSMYEGRMVVRATIAEPGDLVRVAGVAESFWSHRIGLGEVDVQIEASARAALEELGIPMRVLIPDLRLLVERERAAIADAALVRGVDWYANYHPLAEIEAYVAGLAAEFPNLATPGVIGTSLEGRSIRVLRISAPEAPGNPRSARPQVLFNACQHAREWATPPTAIFTAESLLREYATSARVRALLERCEVLVVPIVNPDGYAYSWTNERFWRKNRRNNGGGTFGVDLNRNWSVGWGGNDGSSPNSESETYRGPSPFSEPETAAMRNFMLAEDLAGGPMAGSLDIHSYSQLILSPWGYTTDLPPQAAVFDRLNAALEAAVEGPFGTDYTAGPTATTIYIASGTAGDWSFGTLGGFGYGSELRDTGEFGFALPADQIRPTAVENYQLALTFIEFAIAPLQITFPQGVPVLMPAGQEITIDFNVDDGSGTLNTASPVLFYRQSPSTGFTAAATAVISGRTFRATIPPLACGRNAEFYVSAATTAGAVSTSPIDAPAGVYSATVAQASTTYDDACEATTGWTVGAAGDNATTGVWGNMVPEATRAQPGEDRSPIGTRCWITDGRAGSGVGTYDVDGGVTTLTSPRFSAEASLGATVSYWRWYSNNQGANPGTNSMPVLISNDDGVTWTTLETVNDNANAWVFRSFRVGDFVTPTANMRLRFVARDLTGAIVEAGVDDVRCDVLGCPGDPADFNGDGFVDFFDYDAFVECFEINVCPPGKTADFNGDGFVDFFDYDAFVEAFEGA